MRYPAQPDHRLILAEGAATMTNFHSTRFKRIAVCVLLAFAAGVGAQDSAKKLYCWNQNGQRVCGDALPPGAIDLERTEISSKSGLETGHVDRALTPAERVAAAETAKQAEASIQEKASRQRRDVALVEAYTTEADLRRAYGDRIELVDLAIRASAMGISNMHTSLVTLLNQANTLELGDKPVPPTLTDKIRTQHAELLRQQNMLVRQHKDMGALHSELDAEVARYQRFKQPQRTAVPSGAQAPAATPPPSEGG